jgi:hypothetical protein
MAVISVFTITGVVGASSVATYTGSITSGATPLVKGTPVVVVGCTTAAFNGTFVITGGNLTTTFTAATSTTHTESESGATATYDPEGVQVEPGNISAYPLGYGAQLRSTVQNDPYGNIPVVPFENQINRGIS